MRGIEHRRNTLIKTLARAYVSSVLNNSTYKRIGEMSTELARF